MGFKKPSILTESNMKICGQFTGQIIVIHFDNDNCNIRYPYTVAIIMLNL
jgi:hypothetical protein